MVFKKGKNADDTKPAHDERGDKLREMDRKTVYEEYRVERDRRLREESRARLRERMMKEDEMPGVTGQLGGAANLSFDDYKNRKGEMDKDSLEKVMKVSPTREQLSKAKAEMNGIALRCNMLWPSHSDIEAYAKILQVFGDKKGRIWKFAEAYRIQGNTDKAYEVELAAEWMRSKGIKTDKL